MKTVVDIVLLAGILGACWQGYRQRHIWFCLIPGLLLHIGRQRSFLFRFCLYAPLFVGWLLLCHWLNAQGWHATSAGLFGFAMVSGLEAMRQVEERWKRMR